MVLGTAAVKRKPKAKRTPRPSLTSTVDKAIGLRLKAFRQQRGLSQTDIGNKLGVSFQQVQKYERGVNRLAGSRLVIVCEVLQVKPEQILGNGSGVFSDNVDLLEPLRDNQTARAFRMMSKLPRLQRIAVMQCIVMLVNAFQGDPKLTGERDD